MTTYSKFLETKLATPMGHGPNIPTESISDVLYPFQRQLVQWAIQKGRAALFGDCGLGKTLMQLEWARQLDCPTLIVCPLAVAQQTVKEAQKLDMDIEYVRTQPSRGPRVNITNYEMLDRFNPTAFDAVILDESSILKSYTGKTRTKLIEMFRGTPYRLCCTATPAPNDIAEFANHIEFLGYMSREEMLAMFFVHDDNGWRLKRHAVGEFYRWMSSWAMMIRKPSDIGFVDAGFDLPPLNIETDWVDGNADALAQANGRLFFSGLDGITGRQAARKATIHQKVARLKDLIDRDDSQWLVWCGLNDEGGEAHKAIPDSTLIEGADAREDKEARLSAFLNGETRILITKPSIAGFGLNLQQCHNVAFLGLSDSYESFYQAIRRVWRFGQEHPVNVHVILSDLEAPVLENIQRKWEQAESTMTNMTHDISGYQQEQLGMMTVSRNGYVTNSQKGTDYQLLLGDCVERIAEIEDSSVGLSVFSPPFLSLYTYSASERDMGNSLGEEEFFTHFGYLMDELLRVNQPGRNVCCHVAQIPAKLVSDGYIGLKDFRGKTIDAFIQHGFIYHGEVVIDKDPQVQAIRTHSKGLLFAQLQKDASWLRPGLADYILVFRKPGENEVAIHPDINNEQWIEWARPIWYNIRESDTLNVAEGRDAPDERHIAPLQLGTIERCIRLWSNPGETIFSPFAGIGSEGYEALLNDRRFIGIELKDSYYQAACRNLERANERKTQQRML